MFERHRILAISTVAICLTGCGGGDEANIKSAPPPPKPPAPAAVAKPAAASAAKPAAPKKQTPTVKADVEYKPNEFLVGGKAPELNIVENPAPPMSDKFYVIPPLAPGSQQVRVVYPESATTPPGQRPATRGTPAPPAFSLPEGFERVPASPLNEDGLPKRIRCVADGSIMAIVPGGVFIQGTDNGDPAAAPEHAAYVSTFYMDINEITVAKYLTFREQQKAASKRTPPGEPINADGDPELPALGINWRDANSYAEATGKSLPTEAEWEKAGRSAEGFVYPWGNGRAVWGRPRLPGQIDLVASFDGDRSVYGIYDLAGNAREWCTDWFAAKAYEDALEKDGSPKRDWEGPNRADTPAHRVVKGGGEKGWELWHRSGTSMRESVRDIGFRCVLRIDLPDAAAGTASEARPTTPATPARPGRSRLPNRDF